MIIRTETPTDYAAVQRLVQQAFLNAAHSDGSEHLLVERLRHSDAFVPRLSLVAERQGEIVGHILFTKIRIGEAEALALAPLAVSLAHQKQGIGKALIEQGHQRARELGFHYCVVLGDPNYYGRFGYQPAANWQIRAPFDVPSEYFMAIALQPSAPKIAGVVQYAKEFGL